MATKKSTRGGRQAPVRASAPGQRAKKSSKKGALKDAYLIVLQGGGDTCVSLVTPEVWAWVVGEAGEVPKAVLDAAVAEGRDREEIRHLDDDNERAMALEEASSLYHQYAGAEEIVYATEWAADHGYRIVETYEGYLY